MGAGWSLGVTARHTKEVPKPSTGGMLSARALLEGDGGWLLLGRDCQAHEGGAKALRGWHAVCSTCILLPIRWPLSVRLCLHATQLSADTR